MRPSFQRTALLVLLAAALFKTSFAAEGQGPAPDLRDRAIVLCWHTFLGRADLQTDFSLSELAAQLDAISALGYHFASLEDLLFGRLRGGMNVVVTIDDGHRSIVPAYEKVFAPRGIKPALFVYPSIIGSLDSALDHAQLRALRDAGCLVGAHGYHHLFVNESLYESDRKSFNDEIYKAKSRVEALTELPAWIYAYPFGAFSPITKTEVAHAGFIWAFAVKAGFVFSDPALDDHMELARYVVTRDSWDKLRDLLRRNAAAAHAEGADAFGGLPSESSLAAPAGDPWGGEER